MSVPATVVINAAGRGRRLGLNCNKALVKIDGKTLIRWQLELLPSEAYVVVGLGYQAEEVAAEALAVRSDVAFAVNPEFATTGTAATLSKTATLAPGRVLSLDADLIVHPDDLQMMLQCDVDTLGVVPITSLDPVGVLTARVRGRLVATQFTREIHAHADVFEWSGLINYDPGTTKVGPNRGHVYEYITPALPMEASVVRARELDFMEELPALVAWIREIERTRHERDRAKVLGTARE